MDTVRNIQEAEEHVADLETALDVVQSGLETAESVAVAADVARRRVALVVKLSIAAIVIGIIAIVLSRRDREER